MRLTDEQIAAIRDGTEARDVSDAMHDANIVSKLLQWADSIDADGDDLRPLLRRAAQSLTDRMAQIKSAVDGAAKFADRAAALSAEVLESRAEIAAKDARIAELEAALPLIRGAVVEEQRKRFTDPHAADWYWRDLDPDDSGDSISEAIHMVGEGVVCHVRSSFTGPDFFAAIVPVLDAESDDTEELIADTEEECVRLVKERYAAIRALSPRETSE